MRYVTKNEVVYARLKEAILDGALSPGERLVVADLAKSFQTSPMPVREAICRLGQEGLVDLVPHVGAKVAAVNLRELAEITAIRVELETMAARLAAARITEADLKQLDALCCSMRASLEKGDATAYEKLNREFHKCAYARCDNASLLSLIMSLWSKTEVTRTVFRRLPGRNAQSFAEHEQWLAALQERDPDKVAAIVYRHKQAAFIDLSEILAREMQKPDPLLGLP